MNADTPVSNHSTPAGGEGASTSARVRTMLDLQRSEFLRMCRTRIRPEDVGLPTSQRARTGGLRREDVAVLAGVSISWYTWLEQGRDIRISEIVLEDERTYLFSLVQGRVPRTHGGNHSAAPPDLERMLQGVGVPAYALNMRWDVLAWNAQTAAIYRDYSTLPDKGRNLMEILLTQPERHQDAAQQEAMVQRLCARLRYDYSKTSGDPEFEALVQRLRARSPLFNRFWQAPDFNLRAYGAHRFAHHRFGDVSFEHTSYVPDGYPDIRVVICIPADDATRRVVAEVNAELAQA
jgi:hypothetical protein